MLRAIKKFIKNIQLSRDIQRKLDALTDYTLLDRISDGR